MPVTATNRNRPRGWLRHYAGFLAPSAAAGMGVAFERQGE